VVSFAVPPLLAKTVEAEPSPQRLAWLADLPQTVAQLAAWWELDVGAPFDPGGQTAWVAPARDGAGRDLVLKVGWRHLEAEHEPDGLRAWRGQGAVLLYDSCSLGLSTALLLERCEPGTPLSAVSPEAEQDLVVAGLLRRLWQAPTAGLPFRPLHAMCRAWVTQFQRRLAASAKATTVVDPGLARAGAELFLALPDSADREVLLCTDLHAGNVLAARRELWLVIDPKPFVGDPCYDVLQHLLNCAERLANDPAGLAQRMADLLDLDGDRVRQWLFARCVIEGLDHPLLRAVATELALACP
jgi:streptomycin 6-kinase